MWSSMFKTVAATAAYAGVHSLLARPWVKEASARLFGRRTHDGLYRVVYNAQSVAGLVSLAWYIRSLPDREIYRARGTLAWAMRAGQLATLAGMGWALFRVGPIRFSGLDGFAGWLAGSPDLPPSPVGQGPSPVDLRRPGEMDTAGPFRHTRHPLNAGFGALLWLNPTMTTNLLAFNLAVTAYLVVGSLSEERRLRLAYGRSYERYQRSGVPFLVPGAVASQPGSA